MSGIDPETTKNGLEGAGYLATFLSSLGILGWIGNKQVNKLDKNIDRTNELAQNQIAITKDVEHHTEALTQLHSRIDGVEHKFTFEHEKTRNKYEEGTKEVINSNKQLAKDIERLYKQQRGQE